MNKIQKFINEYNLKEKEPVIFVRESADNFIYLIGLNHKKVLRISKRLPIKDIRFEFEVFDYLSKNNFPVPKWNKTKNGVIFSNIDETIGVLFDFIDGMDSGGMVFTPQFMSDFREA